MKIQMFCLSNRDPKIGTASLIPARRHFHVRSLSGPNENRSDPFLCPFFAPFTTARCALLELRLSNGEILKPTPPHRFYSETRKDWVAAQDLRVGECLRTKSGQAATVKSVGLQSGEHRVYNLEVEQEHQFYVGEGGVLVHNAYDTIAERQARVASRSPQEIADRQLSLRADSLRIWREFEAPFEREGTTVATGVFGEQRVYTVSNNRTTPEVRAMAESLGYERVFGKEFTGPGQTDAEQIMLNWAQGRLDPANPSPIAPSRIPCGPSRQDCWGRIATTPGVRLVGPWNL